MVSVNHRHPRRRRPADTALSVSAILDANESKTGTTNAYGLEPGQYYIQAISGCDWTLTLTPK